jgi:pilus assembly protein Flp/PilA
MVARPFSNPHISSHEVKSMQQLKKCAGDFLRSEEGPTAVEYAVMLALIIAVCIAAISTLGSNASNTFSYVNTKVSTAS